MKDLRSFSSLPKLIIPGLAMKSNESDCGYRPVKIAGLGVH